MLSQQAYGLSGQEILDEIALFPAELQQTGEMTKIRENAEQKLKTDVGQPYIDVVQPDADGKEVSLKSVVENPATKYVLLDFWASWCGPCMGEVPHLKKTYGEFHDKGFEIYGVSFDNNRDKWLAAVKDNGMDWIHVSTLERIRQPGGQGLRRTGHSHEPVDRPRGQDRRQEPARRGALREDRGAAEIARSARPCAPPVPVRRPEGRFSESVSPQTAHAVG